MNRVHQYISLDGRHLTSVVIKSGFIVMFLNNGKHLSNTSHYFGKSAIVFSMNINGKSCSERVQYIAVRSAGYGLGLMIYSVTLTTV
jgi:hypothetical protein